MSSSDQPPPRLNGYERDAWRGQKTQSIRDTLSNISALRRRQDEIIRALEAVLIFHGADWGPDKARLWNEITGVTEATTKVLCDHARRVLAREDGDV